MNSYKIIRSLNNKDVWISLPTSVYAASVCGRLTARSYQNIGTVPSSAFTDAGSSSGAKTELWPYPKDNHMKIYSNLFLQ